MTRYIIGVLVPNRAVNITEIAIQIIIIARVPEMEGISLKYRATPRQVNS